MRNMVRRRKIFKFAPAMQAEILKGSCPYIRVPVQNGANGHEFLTVLNLIDSHRKSTPLAGGKG